MQGQSQKYIFEHQSLPLKQNFFTIIMIIEAIFWGLYSKIKLRDIFLLLGLSLMSIMSMRHIGLLALIVSFCLARTVSSFFNGVKDADIKVINFFKKWWILLIGSVGSIAACILLIIYQNRAPYVDEVMYPVEMSKYIKENLDYKNIRMFNEYNFGSYLLFNDIPVLIDSRADLYTKEFNGLENDIFVDCMKIKEENYIDFFNFYKLNYALVYNYSAMDEWLSKNEDFKSIKSDDYFTLYERLSVNNE